jgi:alpha-beta hydrolase superfamily lysophospholipase
MNDRLRQYVDLHRRIERSLPKVPKEATPQQIDKNQRALEKLLREARAYARNWRRRWAGQTESFVRELRSVFRGAGFSFDRSPDLRARLFTAIDRIAAPVLFSHAENDYSLSSAMVLDARRERL